MSGSRLVDGTTGELIGNYGSYGNYATTYTTTNAYAAPTTYSTYVEPAYTTTY